MNIVYLKTSFLFNFDNKLILEIDIFAITLVNIFINNIKSDILSITLNSKTIKLR